MYSDIDGKMMVGYICFVTLCCVGFAALIAFVLINWAMGCGEVFYYPDGTWQTGECFLLPYEVARGTW